VEFTVYSTPFDTTPPKIIVTSPQETTYSTSEIDFKFTVSEKVNWKAYSLDGNDNVTISGTTVISGLSEGSHTIVVFATDTAGNTGASDAVQFVISTSSIDTTPPMVTINSPENTTYNANNISLNFTINEEPTLKFYSLDGKANITAAQLTEISDLSTGQHTLIVYAQDLTGNIGASKQVAFTIVGTIVSRELWIVGLIGMVAFTGFILTTYIAYDLFRRRRKQI
jgi:hypothetical protein